MHEVLVAELPGTLLERYQKHIIFVCFVSLGSLIKLTQHGARQLKYNFLCPIIVISLLKLICSLLLYRHLDGPFSGIAGKLQSARKTVLRYGAVAMLFCFYDVLSFVNLGIFDPQTYLVFLQLRTVCTGALWEVAFKRPLGNVQRAALVLICVACIVKQTGGGLNLQNAATTSLPMQNYVLLALQVAANCLAGVTNELLLKSKGGMPLNLQNAVQYSWTVIWCLLAGLLCPLDGVRLNPFDMEAWMPMLDERMLPNIVVLTALGLLTSVLLKLLDSVLKAIATAVELFLTAYVSALIFGYHVKAMDFVALCVAALGVGCYAMPDKVSDLLQRLRPAGTARSRKLSQVSLSPPCSPATMNKDTDV